MRGLGRDKKYDWLPDCGFSLLVSVEARGRLWLRSKQQSRYFLFQLCQEFSSLLLFTTSIAKSAHEQREPTTARVCCCLLLLPPPLLLFMAFFRIAEKKKKGTKLREEKADPELSRFLGQKRKTRKGTQRFSSLSLERALFGYHSKGAIMPKCLIVSYPAGKQAG